MAFAPGLIAFSGQYVLSRGFYAISDTRTPFLLNLVIAALNAGLSGVRRTAAARALGGDGHGRGVLRGAVRGVRGHRRTCCSRRVSARIRRAAACAVAVARTVGAHARLVVAACPRRRSATRRPVHATGPGTWSRNGGGR